jgi:hypothetical protein
MRLFKFVDFRGVDILRNERIKFTPPQEFKDPFEMQLGITNQAAKQFARQILDERQREAMRELPGYKNLSHRQRKKGRREMVKTSEMVSLIKESFQKVAPDESTKKLGILSLCKSYNSNLMWYHYADGHRGFALEFDDSDNDFKSLGQPWKVDYADKPPAYDGMAAPLFFRIKPHYLLHEGEYRIIRFLHECESEKRDDDQTMFFRKLSRRCVKAVYLGHRMEKPVRDEVLQLLNGTDVLKFDAVPNQEDYTLLFREIN